MGKRKSQNDHDTLILRAIKQLDAEGYHSFQADVDGYERPNTILWKSKQAGLVPDIVAHHPDFGRLVVEVETEDSIDDHHTKDQWRLFHSFAKSGERRRFMICVPAGCRERTISRAIKLSVPVEVLEIG